MMEDWLERGPAVSGPGKRKRETQTEQEEMARIKPRTGENVTSFFQRWYNNWIQRMATTDVVFVTYDTLGKDLDVALAPVERPRRAVAGPPREKPRSVLSMCQFWRVRRDANEATRLCVRTDRFCIERLSWMRYKCWMLVLLARLHRWSHRCSA
jgi:hypothetical protein